MVKAQSATKNEKKALFSDVIQSKQALKNAVSFPSDLGEIAGNEISAALNIVIADVFALYVKTKNFHWHVNGAHFRDYHVMFDEHSDELLAMVDPLAERIRKLGCTTIRSIDHIAKLQTIAGNNEDVVDAKEMLKELCQDNISFTANLRKVREISDEHGDTSTTGLIEDMIGEAEQRAWFLFEMSR